MTLREGVCSNRQSTVIGGWQNRYITFVVAKKKLNLRFILLYFRYLWEEGLVENVILGGGGLNCSKNRHMIFELKRNYEQSKDL